VNKPTQDNRLAQNGNETAEPLNATEARLRTVLFYCSLHPGRSPVDSTHLKERKTDIGTG
jgi:hypothetical protein